MAVPTCPLSREQPIRVTQQKKAPVLPGLQLRVSCLRPTDLSPDHNGRKADGDWDNSLMQIDGCTETAHLELPTRYQSRPVGFSCKGN
jgi:hypothetical protein